MQAQSLALLRHHDGNQPEQEHKHAGSRLSAVGWMRDSRRGLQ